MLINLSNHPSSQWDYKQKKTAEKAYGTITDLYFPAVDPNGNEQYIRQLAEKYFQQITTVFDQCANNPKPNAVHIQGEFNFVFNLVALLLKSGITCVASTSKREVITSEKNEKFVKFEFVKFRKYRLP